MSNKSKKWKITLCFKTRTRIQYDLILNIPKELRNLLSMSPRRVYNSIGTLSWYTVKQSQSTNWRIVTLETSQDYDRDRSEDILNTIYNQYDTYYDFDRDLDTPWHVVIEINSNAPTVFFPRSEWLDSYQEIVLRANTSISNRWESDVYEDIT